MLYRPKFSFGVVIEAKTEEEAWMILEDRMRKEPRSFVSSLELVEPLRSEKSLFRRIISDR